MIGELLLRFVVGGAIVAAFSTAAEVLKPKTLAGLFSAAPSVALASLGLACAQQGVEYVSIEGRSMGIGAVGLLVYALVCSFACRRSGVSVALSAGAAWGAWLLVALGLALVVGVWRPA